MDTTSLDRMLIANIADLDAATRRLHEIQIRISSAIDEAKSRWAIANGWGAGDDDWHYGDDCCVRPPKWYEEEDGTDWSLWFELWYDANAGDIGEESDYFWVTRLCGESQHQIGFRLAQNGLRKRDWKSVMNENSEALDGTRIIYDDEPSFFLPFTIDKTALAQALENDDFETALKPMTDALDHIRDNIEKFEPIHTAYNAKL